MKASFTKKQAALIADICFSHFCQLENKEGALTETEAKTHKRLDKLIHGGALSPLMKALCESI